MIRIPDLRTPAIILFAAFALAALLACTNTDEPATALIGAAELPGHDIAERLCSGCHAIGRTGASPHADSLPFRQISQVYPVRSLEEALGEGIFVGHPDMPPFQLEPDDIDNLLDYIEAIQDPV